MGWFLAGDGAICLCDEFALLVAIHVDSGSQQVTFLNCS